MSLNIIKRTIKTVTIKLKKMKSDTYNDIKDNNFIQLG